MSQQITIEVSAEVVRQASQVAVQRQQKIEDVLAAWLESAVIERPVEELHDVDLLALTEIQVTDAQQETLSELLERNREGDIDEDGKRQLDELMRLYEHGLLRKSQALRVAVERELCASLQS